MRGYHFPKPARGSLTGFMLASAFSVQALAQAPTPGASPPASSTDTQPSRESPASPPGLVPLDSLPAGLKLGVRANFVQRQLGVVPTVVIVSDPASYAAAIAGWTTGKSGALRYPVLIDDQTFAARTRIARFVRAFKPTSVVRWQAPDNALDWPIDADKRQNRIASAASLAWGAEKPDQLKERFTSIGHQPQGVVAMNADDPAWAGGLALAAFRGQPIAWVKPIPGTPHDFAAMDQADALTRQITGALDAQGYAYKELGDTIDAVTLALNMPVKIFLGEADKRQFLAVADVIGRSADPKTDPQRTSRWAFAAQLLGDQSQSAYDAMCAVFLQPETAWLFDGYDSGAPWNDYDMTKAAGELKPVKLNILLDDRATGSGVADLRKRSAGVRAGSEPTRDGTPAGMGVDAQLIFFNTSGNPDFFDLKPGQAKPVDVPILRTPSAVCFVHSYSAAVPDNRATVAGMWRERGAFCYFGSVHEPYLQTFVPTPLACRRLASGFAWGAAMRQDQGPPWKLTCLGDPLFTLGPTGPRVNTPLPLASAAALSTQVPELLKDKRYAEAAWALVLSGRDRDAVRLVSAVAKDPKQGLSPELALAGVSSAFLLGEYDAFVSSLESLGPILNDADRVDREGLAQIRDMFWQAQAGQAWTAREAAAAPLMLRPEVLERDQAEALRLMEPLKRPELAQAVRARAKILREPAAPGAKSPGTKAPAPGGR